MQTHLEIKEHRLDDHDLREERIYSLPIEKNHQSTAYAPISPKTLSQLLLTEDFLKKFILVDCRYPYEYHGGHIEGAVNMYDAAELEEVFFSEPDTKKRIPIFYCEYSQCRGPNMAAALRSLDRTVNAKNYPTLTYQEIYVLDGGYQNFFTQKVYLQHCTHRNYVKMDDINFKSSLKAMNWHKKGRKQRSVSVKVSRFYQKNEESTFQAARLNFSSDGSFLEESMTSTVIRSPGTPKSRKSY